jgi:hypothetical protein
MIDIITSISPIDGEYPNIKKWAGSISLKGGEDDNILHWHIVSESPKQIVKTQIGALESMKDAIEKRIKLLESSLID